MALILAIEPDRRQATQLSTVIKRRLDAELILVETTEKALDAIGNRMPDLVLVPALLSPQDDAALAAALRVIAAAAHVQMLTIPVLGSAKPTQKMGGVLSALRRGKNKPAVETDGCDPAVFAEQIASYLDNLEEERKRASAAGSRVLDVAPSAKKLDIAPSARKEEPQVETSHGFDEFVDEPPGDSDEPVPSPSPSLMMAREAAARSAGSRTQHTHPPAPQAEPPARTIEPATRIDQDEMRAAAAPEVVTDESVSLALQEAVRALFAESDEPAPVEPSSSTDGYEQFEEAPAAVSASSVPDDRVEDPVADELPQAFTPDYEPQEAQSGTEPEPEGAPEPESAPENMLAYVPEPLEVVSPAFSASEAHPAADEDVREYEGYRDEHADALLEEPVVDFEAMRAAPIVVEPQPEEVESSEHIDLQEAASRLQEAASGPEEPVVVPAPRARAESRAARGEWEELEELMAALDLMPLAALEATAEDEWIGPPQDVVVAAARERAAVPEKPSKAVEKAAKSADPKTPEPRSEGSSERAPARSEREWVALIESLRHDVERLRTERAEKPAKKTPDPAKKAAAEPAKKGAAHKTTKTESAKAQPPVPDAARADKKGKPIQDEWGFFDPEQCGFAALLAKLDEVTDDDVRDAPAQPRRTS